MTLAYDKSLELPSLDTFEEKVDFINENVFMNTRSILSPTSEFLVESETTTFKKFYNIRSKDNRTKEEEQQIRDRWIGVQRVGARFPDESFKMTIDFIAGYLLNTKELSVREAMHDFRKLRRIEIIDRKDNQLSHEDNERLKEHKKNVIYSVLVQESNHEDDIVFYNNELFEDYLKEKSFSLDRQIKNLEENKGFHPDGIDHLRSLQESIDKRLKRCEKIKQIVERKKDFIEIHRESITKISNTIKYKYSILKKDMKNRELLDEIVVDVNQIRTIKEIIHRTEIEIGMFADEYRQITELQVNYQQ